MFSWEIKDILMIGDKDTIVDTMSLELTNLKPYTQYAMYISAYTTLNANRGAQSNITYFMTEPTGEFFTVYTVYDLYRNAAM